MKDYEMQEDFILAEDEEKADLLDGCLYYFDGNPDNLEFAHWRDLVW